MPSNSTPVLFLIFNRPDLTRKTFEKIRTYKPKRLFIAADGPRAGHPGEEALCKQCIEATQCIDWDCEVHRLERKENLGCRVAVSSAISWFFDHVEEGIILEDDCMPDPSFFSFCSEMLEYYRDAENIGIVSGDNFLERPCPDSYYFTSYPQIWGWATWRRVWRHYDVDIAAWNGNPRSLAPHIKRRRVRSHFAGRFNSVKWGGKDTWDFQLVHLCFSRGLYCINPAKNLVTNIGFDERGTHTQAKDQRLVLPDSRMEFPLRHPRAIRIDEQANRLVETCVQKVPPFFYSKWLRSIKKRYRRVCQFIFPR